MEQDETKKPRNITVGFVLGWILGILAALGAIALLFSETLIGILMLLIAAVLLPPINTFVIEKFNVSFSGGMKLVLIFGLLIVIVVIAPADPQADNLVNNENSTSQNQVNETHSEEQGVTNVNESNDRETPTQNHTDDDPALELETNSETVSQKNAVRQAKAYLDYTAFSRDGLVEQLEYEQFSNSDAIYGADNSGADWYEQATKSAERYMDYSAFSRGGLIDQLKFEGYTQTQAAYGADSVGL